MNESISLVLQTLEKQLSDRLEKLWRVFSWCSSILISITGGIIISCRSGKFKLLPLDHIIVLSVILIITIYASLWINENLRMETKIRDQISAFEGVSRIKDQDSSLNAE
mgnify:CR=1 FL=1